MGQMLTEHFGDLGRGLVAPGRVLGVQLLDDRGQPVRDLGVGLADRRRRLVADATQHGHQARCPEGRPARAHGVQHAAQAEQVAARVHRLAPRLLRRHVVRRAGDHPALRQVGVVGRPRQAEIGELDALDAVLQQDVSGFDVAVDQPLGVGGDQAGGRLHADAQDLGQGQRPAAAEPILQRLAGHVLHHQVRQAVGLLDRVDGDDVIVADRGLGLGLAHEAPTSGGAGRQLRRHDLDGHDPVQLGIERS
jgi:hypothetical protein